MLKQERIPTTTAGEVAYRSTNVINDSAEFCLCCHAINGGWTSAVLNIHNYSLILK